MINVVIDNTCFPFAADNRTKRRRQARHKIRDFTVFAEKKENQRIHISPQLTLAMFQYLSTSRKKCFDLRKYEIYIKMLLKYI